jgi:hypothetical protein
MDEVRGALLARLPVLDCVRRVLQFWRPRHPASRALRAALFVRCDLCGVAVESWMSLEREGCVPIQPHHDYTCVQCPTQAVRCDDCMHDVGPGRICECWEGDLSDPDLYGDDNPDYYWSQ